MSKGWEWGLLLPIRREKRKIPNKVILFLFCGCEEVPLTLSTQPIHKELEAAAPKEAKIKKEARLYKGWGERKEKFSKLVEIFREMSADRLYLSSSSE